MKAYKFKSLLYLFAFILSALLYHSLETSADPASSQSHQLVVETSAEQPIAENL